MRSLRTLVCALPLTLGVVCLFAQGALARAEKLACQGGTESRLARIGMVVVRGKVRQFAYYSKWAPKTCSVSAARGDAYSRWVDHGRTTTVTLPKGKAVIEEVKPGEYRVTFEHLDRDFYCGMSGEINGTVTVWRHKSQCALKGVLDDPGGGS